MSDYSLIVIGGGEAGLLAALHGAELGAKVVLVDKGHAWRTPEGGVRAPKDLVARLERV